MIALLSVVGPGTALAALGTIGVLGVFGGVAALGYSGAIDRLGTLWLFRILGSPDGSGVLPVRFPTALRDATMAVHDRSIALDVFGALDAISMVGILVALGVLVACWTGTVAAVHVVVRTVARRG